MLVVLNQRGGALLTRSADGRRLRLEGDVPTEVSEADGAILLATDARVSAVPDPARPETDTEAVPEPEQATAAVLDAPAAPEPTPITTKAEPKAKPEPKPSGAISVADLSAGGRKK